MNSWVGTIVTAIQKAIAAVKSFIAVQAQAGGAAPVYESGPAMPAFRDGGDFRVPGAGKTDSKLIQFMASPGEHITIETPMQRYANDNLPGFRDGGSITVGKGGGGGMSNSILLKMLMELRSIRRAIGGSGGSTGGSSGGSSGGSTGGGGSVIAFDPGDLYNPGIQVPGTGTGTGTGTVTNPGTTTPGTDINSILNSLADMTGAPQPSLDVFWEYAGSTRLDDVNSGFNYAPRVSTNASILDGYMERKGAAFKAAAGNTAIPSSLRSSLVTIGNLVSGYDSGNIQSAIKDAYLQHFEGQFSDVKQAAGPNLNLAEAALSGLGAFLYGGFPQVNANVPEYPGYNPNGQIGYGPGKKIPDMFGDTDNFDNWGGRFTGSRFRDGGDFTVPGAGGVDSRSVQFMASPGETVSVRTRAQQVAEDARRGGDKTVTVHVTIQTPDSNSFQRNKKQTELTLKNILGRVA